MPSEAEYVVMDLTDERRAAIFRVFEGLSQAVSMTVNGFVACLRIADPDTGEGIVGFVDNDGNLGTLKDPGGLMAEMLVRMGHLVLSPQVIAEMDIETFVGVTRAVLKAKGVLGDEDV